MFAAVSPSRVTRLCIALAGVMVFSACDFFATPGNNPTAALRKVAGDGQSAPAGAELPLAVAVVAEDADGHALTGQQVAFVVTSGGGIVAGGSAVTDDGGMASDRWTLGPDAAVPQRLEARVIGEGGEAVLVAEFTATAMTGGASSIEKVAGDGQTGLPGERLADSLTVRVEDQHGNPVAGVQVTWSATSGSVVPNLAFTSASGIARTSWTLGNAAGSYSASASVAGLVDATFSAGTSFNGATLTKTQGDAQSAPTGAQLPAELVVTLRTGSGQTIRDAWVRWTPAAGGGTAVPDSSRTDAAGEARARWTMPTVSGPVTLLADVAGQASTTFTATATAGAAATIVMIAGNSQIGDVGAVLADSLAVEVRDAAGNPVVGDTIVWTVTAGGGGGAFGPGPSVTNALGIARAAWTLGLKSDAPHAATAAAAGLAPVAFSATPRLPPTLLFTATAGDGQTAGAGAALAESLEVTVRLADTRPVEGVRITWSAPGTLSPSAPRSALDGTVRASWTLGGTPGTQRAVARWLNSQNAVVDSVTFTATAQAGSAATIAVLAGNGQTGIVGARLTDSLAVVVRDAGGNAVPGALVTWTVTAGGGTAAPAPSVTGANGVARTPWTLGLEADVTHTATATVTGGAGPAQFTATATLPATLLFTKTGGDAQVGTAGTALQDSLEVTVRLTDGRAVKGVQVSWSAAAGSGSIAAGAVRTGADGRARGKWTLGATAGPQSAVAKWHTTAGAVADSVTFTVTANP